MVRVSILVLSSLVVLEVLLRLLGLFFLEINSAKDSTTIDSDFRIVFLGESTTFGLGVDPEDAFPIVSKNYLRDIYPLERVSTYNLGQPTITSNGILRKVDQVLLKFNPDLIVLQVGFNDLVADRNQVDLPFLPEIINETISSFRTYKLVSLLTDVLKKEYSLESLVYYNISQTYLGKDSSQFSRLFRKLRSNIATIESKARGYDVPIILVGYIGTEDVNSHLSKYADDLRIPFVDVYIPTPERIFNVTEDNWHPNERGHDYIANKVVNTIIEEGYVDEGITSF